MEEIQVLFLYSLGFVPIVFLNALLNVEMLSKPTDKAISMMLSSVCLISSDAFSIRSLFI